MPNDTITPNRHAVINKGDEMPEVETITTNDATEWTRGNPPPEDVAVVIRYAVATPHTFYFKNSILAYDHYLRKLHGSATDSLNPITVAEMFLTDTIAQGGYEELTTFLATPPGQAIMLSLYRVVNALSEIFSGTITVEIKNISTQAQP